MILGWVWNLGTIQASSRRIDTLASCLLLLLLSTTLLHN